MRNWTALLFLSSGPFITTLGMLPNAARSFSLLRETRNLFLFEILHLKVCNLNFCTSQTAYLFEPMWDFWARDTGDRNEDLHG